MTDEERIEFLEQTAQEIEVHIRAVPDPECGYRKQFELSIGPHGRTPIIPGLTLREAIDTAMKVIA